jgi:hypothetical protein
MVRFLTVAIIALSPLVLFAQLKAEAEPKDSPTASVGKVVKEMAADLKEARELLKKVSDKAVRERLELLITRSELKAVEIEKTLGGLTPSTPAATPISAEDFAKLMKGLKAESFDEGKAAFVALFAAKGRLTCAQARDVLKAFSFDDDRIKSAVLLYPRITDQENFFTVLDVFTFSSSKDDLRAKLKLK